MKNLKKIFLASIFGLGLAVSLPIQEANASCSNAYDVTYPSKYCDPKGFGSCTRKCPGEQ